MATTPASLFLLFPPLAPSTFTLILHANFIPHSLAFLASQILRNASFINNFES